MTWNAPSWSISAEFLANMLFGVCFVLAPRGRILVALALSAVGAAVLLVFSEQTINTSSEFGLFRCMYGFFLGYVVYRVATADGAPSLPGRAAASIAEVAILAATAMFVALANGTP